MSEEIAEKEMTDAELASHWCKRYQEMHDLFCQEHKEISRLRAENEALKFDNQAFKESIKALESEIAQLKSNLEAARVEGVRLGFAAGRQQIGDPEDLIPPWKYETVEDYLKQRDGK